MNTLIVYGTRYGLTERCAKSLAGKLSGKIQLVNIENQPVNNISEYDRVIIAASVYLGKIQKSIIKFCDKNYSEILNKRIGIFICCCNQEKLAGTWKSPSRRKCCGELGPRNVLEDR